MGWLKQGTATYAGEPGYDEAVKHIRQHAAIQFIREYKASPPTSTTATSATGSSKELPRWTWGDELEHLLVQFPRDTPNQEAEPPRGAGQAALSSHEIEKLKSNVALVAHALLPRMQARTNGSGLWSPEYADFQIESSPMAPYDTTLGGLCSVEVNMRRRIVELNEELHRWSGIEPASTMKGGPLRTASLTCYWFLGAAAAAFPSGGLLTQLEESHNTVTGSCFLSDSIIAPHPRMRAVTLGVLHNKWRLYDGVFGKYFSLVGSRNGGVGVGEVSDRLLPPPQLNVTPLFVDERTTGSGVGPDGGSSPVDPILLVDRHPNNDRLLKKLERFKQALSEQSSVNCNRESATPSSGGEGENGTVGKVVRLEGQDGTEGDISTANTSFQRVPLPSTDIRNSRNIAQHTSQRSKVIPSTITDLSASQNSFAGETEHGGAHPSIISNGPGRQERSLGSDQDVTPSVLSPPFSREDTPSALSPSRRGSTAAAAQLYSPTKNHTTSVIYSHYTTPAQSRRGSKTDTPEEQETFDARTHLSQCYLQDLLLQRHAQANKPANEVKGDLPSCAPSLGPVILMDSVAFGPTMCCLQFTVEFRTQSEARRAADFLLILSPLMLALSSATPFQKGLLRDCDVRWSTLSQSMDDRLEGEQMGCDKSTDAGLMSKPDKKAFHKSRYDSCSLFVSDLLADEQLDLLNDVEVIVHEESRDEMLRSGVDPAMAQYVAHLFARQPIVVYQNFLDSVDDRWQSDHFVNLQSSNYHTVRLKPPTRTLIQGTHEKDGAIDSNAKVSPTTVPSSGWRVEFRPMEIQPTPFENAAFCVFCVLLLQEVIECHLESLFYMPVSYIDRNMEQAHHRSPLDGEFYWASGADGSGEVVPSSIADIFLRPKNGLLVLARRRLRKLREAGGETSTSVAQLEEYLDFFEARVNRRIPTVAEYLRSRVRSHTLYQRNSVVPTVVGEELLKEMSDAAVAEAAWLRLPWLIPSS